MEHLTELKQNEDARLLNCPHSQTSRNAPASLPIPSSTAQSVKTWQKIHLAIAASLSDFVSAKNKAPHARTKAHLLPANECVSVAVSRHNNELKAIDNPETKNPGWWCAGSIRQNIEVTLSRVLASPGGVLDIYWCEQTSKCSINASSWTSIGLCPTHYWRMSKFWCHSIDVESMQRRGCDS